MAPRHPDRAHAAALAGLPGMTPVRLARLLDGFDPVLAFAAVRAGAHPADERRRFRAGACATDVADVEAAYLRAGVSVLLPGRPGYPTRLVGDPGAPAVLFARGDPSVVEDRPAVALVGTRSATHYGRQVASELASGLDGHGVSTVSGLALGIDAAAHAGAMRGPAGPGAPPVAVVGTGLDVVYPSANRSLWEEVAARGVVLAESPLGTRPRPGVFPARNRIIAALSDVVVVVECHLRGGALYTAEAAARRSIPVCAVPGSVRSRSSGGTNALLVDGCAPVRDTEDILCALALARSGLPAATPSATGPRSSSSGPARRPAAWAGRPGRDQPPASPVEAAVLAAVDDVPTPLETILLRTGCTVAEVAQACDRLVQGAALVGGPGWWSLA